METEADGDFFTIDTETLGYPVVHICIRRAPKDDSEIDLFTASFKYLLKTVAESGAQASRSRLCLVMALDGITGASISHQFRAAGVITAVKPLVSEALFCTALVVRSELALGILRLILGMVPLVSVNRVFGSGEEAISWAQANAARQADGEEATASM